MDLVSVKELVRRAMLEEYDLRLHRNRDMLYDNILAVCGRKISPECVTRAQRKLWEDGECLPREEDMSEWLENRRSGEERFVHFSRYGGGRFRRILCAQCFVTHLTEEGASNCCSVGFIVRGGVQASLEVDM